MRFCVVCATVARDALCVRCGLDLERGPSFLTPGGVMVAAGLGHHGTARRLVHALKYDGVVAAAGPLARAMADRVPVHVDALVPVPRATMRRWRHGVDAAAVLAELVGRGCGIPVVQALRPAMWWPRHAGRGDGPRSQVRFSAHRAPSGARWMLVDDVATTGTTLEAAAAALRGSICTALVATAPSRMRRIEGLDRRSRELGGGVASRRPHPTAPQGATSSGDLDPGGDAPSERDLETPPPRESTSGLMKGASVDVRVHGKNMQVDNGTRRLADEKVRHAARILDAGVTADVEFAERTNPRRSDGRYLVEITSHAKGHTVRVEADAADDKAALDLAVDKFERQLRRLKERLIQRTRTARPAEGNGDSSLDGGATPAIVRTKSFEMRPMSTDEAILQMEMLGHDFFFFLDAETGKNCVLYHRKDGTLGLIEPA